ncbi:hypothetical protein CJ030_MR6G010309 [Morella rubra]|uniref:Uncharacterized protein n=1 Tax=Morella rubra TaxID=262757 RepID=A0A6A1VDN2_9ROSI|nr:hypothetical protein CJ030_MR6G010309 [Morella rubra]
MKLNRAKRLCKDVSQLVLRLDMQSTYQPRRNFLTYQVTVELDVLGAFVKNRIGSYVKGGLIVTK